MAVVDVGIIPVVIPFVEVAVLPYGVRMELLKLFGNLLREVILNAEYISRGKNVDKELADDGEIGRSAIAGGTLIAFIGDIFGLRTRARGSDKLIGFVRIPYQPLGAELRRALHKRECFTAQVVLVVGVEVVVPDGTDHPCASHIPVAPLRVLLTATDGRCLCPDVAVVATAPSVVDAVVVASRVDAIIAQRRDKSLQRLCHFRQVDGLSGPVALLEIDVHGVVAVPWRVEIWRPQSLQHYW